MECDGSSIASSTATSCIPTTPLPPRTYTEISLKCTLNVRVVGDRSLSRLGVRTLLQQGYDYGGGGCSKPMFVHNVLVDLVFCTHYLVSERTIATSTEFRCESFNIFICTDIRSHPTPSSLP